MNTLIQALADQAEDYADSIVDQGGEFHLAYTQKLAELIVKECLTFVEPMPGSGDIDDLALEAARRGIKEHFGVKE